MIPFVALLRGINVGGKNVIPMAALKLCFEESGFESVATYIQSGNVIFSSKESDAAKLARRIESLLSRSFRYQASVVLRSRRQMREIVAKAPKGFGGAPERYRYDVIFLKEPLTAASAMQSVRVKEGVDTAHAGKGALYFSRLTARASQSHLPRLISMPVYQSMTVRNWNTTTKLLAMMERPCSVS